MDLSIKTENGVVNFENVNLIKKKAVRGLLRKRAKQYESASDSYDDSDSNTNKVANKKKVQKSSMADAFRSIMNKKINEAPADTPANKVGDATLSKYKKKAREADEKIAKEDEELKKR